MNFEKISPRSSGRQKRTQSQDRYGLQQYGYLNSSIDQHRPRFKNMNQSLPVSTDFTTAKYLFPSSKDNTPFLVKIPKMPPITLADVKRHLPKKGFYRFYFKTELDGEAVFQEENDEHVTVPLWKGTVTVQCSDCGLL